MHSPKQANRVVFVWDGTRQSVDAAVEQAKRAVSACTHLMAIHALPHESIHSYGVNEAVPAPAQNIYKAFSRQTRRYLCFQNAQLTIRFGERIQEICRFATETKADLIVAGAFEQSTFSRWMHGDLNGRLAKNAPCNVLFVHPLTVQPYSRFWRSVGTSYNPVDPK